MWFTICISHPSDFSWWLRNGWNYYFLEKNVFKVKLFQNFSCMCMYFVLSYNAMKEKAKLCVLGRKERKGFTCRFVMHRIENVDNINSTSRTKCILLNFITLVMHLLLTRLKFFWNSFRFIIKWTFKFRYPSSIK